MSSLLVRVDTNNGPLHLEAGDSVLRRLWLPGRVPPGDVQALKPRELAEAGMPWLLNLTEDLRAYMAGDQVPLERWARYLDFAGLTPFRRSVYEELLCVPWGETCTYGRLAARVGRPGAARAVGRAVGSNPFPPIVPCHRVVAANGLGGFGGGLALKRLLLSLEGAYDA